MAVDTYALTTVSKAKAYLRVTDDELQVPALRIYNSSADATSATVTVTAANMRLIVTGGANADDTTLTFADANKDTLTELVTAIEALAKGWVVTRYGPENAASADLTAVAATDCLADANAQVLYMVNNWLIERLVDAVSAAIETYCDRQFLSRDYVEWYDGTGTDRLLLNQYLVTAVALLSVGTRNALQVKNESSDATYATMSISGTTLTCTITGGANDGSNAITLSAIKDISAIAVEINALGKDWSATAVSAYTHVVSTELRERPALYCLNCLAYLEIPDLPATEFQVYGDRAEVYYPHGFSEGASNVRVKYTAGYSSTPADLEETVWKIIADNYHRSQKDGSLKSEKIGDYSYTVADVSISPVYKSELFTWRRMA